MNTNVKQWLSAAEITVFLFLLAFAIWLSWMNGALGEGPILLRVVERYRDKPFVSMEFVEQSDRHFLCVQGISKGRVWIMLDPRYAPFYKQMPMEQFSLTEEDMSEIYHRKPGFDRTVIKCLESHVVATPK